MNEETRASRAIAGYLARTNTGVRTRFTPEKDAVTQRDPTLRDTVFFRYPDGSSVRLDNAHNRKLGDIQEF